MTPYEQAAKYHSITFGTKNTWVDWRMVPTTRPVFAPPAHKTHYIDVPGMDGPGVDLSNTLTKYPTYENRKGSLEFIVFNQNAMNDGYSNWAETYSRILNYLHGKKLEAYLADDPDYFYKGYFTVNEWRSDPNWSLIVIDYDVEPYKYSKSTSTYNDWRWDPLFFSNEVCLDRIYTIEQLQAMRHGDEINKGTFDYLNVQSNDYIWFDCRGKVGQMPVVPTFTWYPNGSDASIQMVRVWAKNPELGVDHKVTIRGANKPTQVPEIVLSEINDGNYVQIGLAGWGHCTIEWRPGSL